MKKIVLNSLFAILATTVASFAQNQTPGSASENVTLNIKLHPIHTLTVNNAADHKVVNLEYTNTDHYANGVTATKEDHISVYSTGGYEIKVKSASTQLTTSLGSQAGTIDASSITITAKDGSAKADAATYSTANLSATESTIVSATQGGVDKKFTIDYKGAGGDAYLNKFIKDQNPSVYTTTVTYTIVAK